MGQLEDMAMFIRLVESGGISKAAEQLGIAKSAVSRRLSGLEKRLSTQLMNRTTRKSNLTDAGAQYYRRAKNILEEVEALNEQTSGQEAGIEGTLKITAPLSFGLMHLSDAIDQFATQHPGLSFQFDFSDRHIDLIEEGYEMAIRIGKLEDSTLQARQITPIKHQLCASPDYLEQHGIPRHPSDLPSHTFLQYGMRNNFVLRMTDQKGHEERIEVTSKIKADNGDFLKQMAVTGHGIVYLPTFLVYQEVTRGRLKTILNEYQLPEMYANAVYPGNRFLSQRCRHFIDFISEHFGNSPYWDNL